MQIERGLGTRVVDGSDAKVMTIRRDYPTDQDDLWNALTDADRLARWFLPVTGELRLGGTYQLEGNAGGTVTACDPPRSFAATWEFAGGVSWIEVELTSIDADRTRFTLRHIARPDDHWKLYGPAAVGIGWDLGLRGLEIHLDTGEPNDAAEFEAWCLRPEGRAFIRACGEGWCAADTAAGTDPAQAREVSERTIGFYSGTDQ
jgi:uncharacterized protein YndB with AHSA1/START domain